MDTPTIEAQPVSVFTKLHFQKSKSSVLTSKADGMKEIEAAKPEDSPPEVFTLKDEEVDESKAKTGTQYLAAAIASLTGVMMGQMLSWSSPVTPLLIKEGKIDKIEESWLVSILNFGAVLGCTAAGSVNSYVGRKSVLLTACLPQMASWLLLALCSDIRLLCLGRFLGGLCVGFFCVTSPLYISEIAQVSVRGALGALFQLSVTIGILTTYTLGLLPTATSITLASSSTVVLFFALFFWMPETPVFLLRTSQSNRAAASLRWFRGPAYNLIPEMRLLERMVQKADSAAAYSDFVTDPASRRALVVALGLFFFQQFSGINAVVFYMNTVFRTAGGDVSPTVATIVIAALQVVGTALSVLLMERAGRRFLFLASFSACTLCVFALGLFFFLKERGHPVAGPWQWVPLGSVGLFLVVYALGAGPVPWAVVGELFSKRMAALAMSLVTGVGHWASAFVVTKAFAMLEAWLGIGGTFWVFVGFCLVGIVFAWALLPETKGRPLQEILDELGGKKKGVKSET
ncbi:trehalose transporter 1-like protein isoform X2 [Bemisia tabaci]|uniref:trehalose transporter 1-like protein isoform X2 n=1 Tax=Bemisia tabaci TaxID=7038 RepID=UPI003B2873DF